MRNDLRAQALDLTFLIDKAYSLPFVPHEGVAGGWAATLVGPAGTLTLDVDVVGDEVVVAVPADVATRSTNLKFQLRRNGEVYIPGDWAFRPDGQQASPIGDAITVAAATDATVVVTVLPGGAPSDAGYLVTTAHPLLSGEVVVGGTPGGELGGTWASPTVDTVHSGSSHAQTQAAAEATAATLVTTEQTRALAAEALLAPKASPAFTGTPTAPTAAVGTNTTQVATMAAVKAAVDALVAGAPGALDTLNEIAAQLASDESAVSALTTTVAGMVAKAGDTMTGELVVPDVKATGKTGATAYPAILAGGLASGAPASGAHVAGEFVVNADASIWVCTASGTPGTWVQANAGAYATKVALWADATAYVVGQLVLSGGVLYRVTTAHTSSGSFDAPKFTAVSSSVVAVNHGADASVARPAGAVQVIWTGSVSPTNKTAADVVVLTDPPNTAPAVPTGLAVTVQGNHKLTIDWADNTEPDLLRYEYRLDGGAAVSTGAVSTTVITGLTNAQTYSIQVRAVDVFGLASAWSVAVTGTPTAAAFNPLTDVPAIHAVWAGDPAWTAPADGAVVDSLRNQSGETLTSTGMARPVYRASVSALGNRPAIEFDGVDDYLDVTLAAAVAGGYKILLVYRHVAVVNSKSVVGLGSSSSAGWNVDSAGKLQFGTNTLVSSTTSANTTGHVARGKGGASGEAWRDGTSILTGNLGTATAPHVRLGCTGTGSSRTRFSNVQISFYAIYSASTSDAELAALADDLKTHYAL